MKIVKTFQLKIAIFTDVKNRCMLHGCVFLTGLKLGELIADEWTPEKKTHTHRESKI